jgi:aryl-alcohol dehydrogenase-like predicted oxidoreductase
MDIRSKKIPGTDLELPGLTVGTMMFGKRADEGESRRIVDAALDRGLNFFDTANMYNDGASEEVLGRTLAGRRDRVVVATKVRNGKTADGEREGLSAAAIKRAIDASLSRLGMEFVDIYYLHQPDYRTPIEESLAAMAELVRAGKVRFVGISNYGGWQSLEILNLCKANGWPAPVITQMLYNPLVRQIEYEYTRFTKSHELLLTVYNPLAGGLLTGKYASLDDEEKGRRFRDNAMYRGRYWSERMFSGMLGLKQIADAAGTSLTHLTLNWVVRKPFVDNILLGPGGLEQFLDCLAAFEQDIPEAVYDRVDEYIAGFEGTDATYAR